MLIDTISLVIKCYLKFANGARLTPAHLEHFLAYSATVLRPIIVHAKRASLAERRGGDSLRVTLNTDIGDSVGHADEEILDLHGALEQLARLCPRLVPVLEMRYFGGMPDAEIAAALGLTYRTMQGDWEKARLLLATALRA